MKQFHSLPLLRWNYAVLVTVSLRLIDSNELRSDWLICIDPHSKSMQSGLQHSV